MYNADAWRRWLGLSTLAQPTKLALPAAAAAAEHFYFATKIAARHNGAF